MKLVLGKWLVVLWIGVLSNGIEGCSEEERFGLLKFKAYIGSLGYDADYLLPSWGDDDPNTDCCQWERITCDSITGHVIQLSLNNTRHLDLYSGDGNMWFLNTSIFQQFKELRSLNLSYNNIGGFMEDEDLKKWSSWNKLEVLDLGYNSFKSSILSSVGALTSLKSLILRNNGLEGPFPVQEVCLLKNLEMLDAGDNQFNSSPPIEDFTSLAKMRKLNYLDLSANSFDRDILNIFSLLSSLETLDLSFNSYLQGPLFVQELAKFNNLRVLKLRYCNLNGSLSILDLSIFKKLEILDLGVNAFSGSIPENAWLPPSLKALSLSNNYPNLTGYLSKQICELKKLKELDLSRNHFEGSVPECLQNLTSLEFLDLSFNRFTGHIPSQIIVSLTSLKYIAFTHNLFEGLISLNSFANHSNLEVLAFQSDSNKFNVVTEYPNWVPPFQLMSLVLQNCGLHTIPEFLFHQFRLQLIDLSGNKINGSFPNWLLQNNTELQYLSLKSNSLSGKIEGIGAKMFPNMTYLNLALNHFEGDFLLSAGGDCNLISLDLSFNNFSGELSERLLSSCINLQFLKLSHNNFKGQVFTSQFNLTVLESLELNGNQFVGTLSGFEKADFIEILDVSNNGFHGEIPRWMNNITNSMRSLDFSHNLFKGQIPCPLLSAEYIDLSHNSFSGPLPICLGLMDNALHINLQRNQFSGSLPDSLFNISRLLTLNLRDNNLSGSIPNTFCGCPNLRLLLLGRNRLNGLIPDRLCQLSNVSLLDLSRNSFTGSIPRCLFNISFGAKGFDATFKTESSFGSAWLEKYLGSLLQISMHLINYELTLHFEEEVEFVSKHMGLTYKGDILKYMSGLDLSQNNLTGVIPYEVGMLSQIHALNLSHNQLTGSIPTSFSNLTQLESLDLSNNELSGEIPTNLIALHFLEVFSVAYNNLSGTIPDMKGQFSTFDNSSFKGNPFLCGPQIKKSGNGDEESFSSTTTSLNDEDGKWYEDDVVFFSSFTASFVMFFLGVITALYVNPYWRNRLFYHSQEFMFSCYYFLYDHLFKYVVRLYHFGRV